MTTRKIHLLNEERNDLSSDTKLLLGLQYELIYAAMLVNRVLSAALDSIKARHTLVQGQKKAFNDACDASERCYKLMEVAFDGTFLEAMSQNGEYIERTAAIQGAANKIINMAMLMYTRENQGINVLRAIENFKADPQYNVEGLKALFPYKED